jgi:hypothetical protein
MGWLYRNSYSFPKHPGITEESGFAGNPQIDSDECCVGSNIRFVVDFNREARVPSISATRDRYEKNAPHKPHFFAHRNPADTRQPDPSAVNLDGIGMLLIRAVVGTEAVMAAFFLNLGTRTRFHANSLRRYFLRSSKKFA